MLQELWKFRHKRSLPLIALLFAVFPIVYTQLLPEGFWDFRFERWVTVMEIFEKDRYYIYRLFDWWSFLGALLTCVAVVEIFSVDDGAGTVSTLLFVPVESKKIFVQKAVLCFLLAVFCTIFFTIALYASSSLLPIKLSVSPWPIFLNLLLGNMGFMCLVALVYVLAGRAVYVFWLLACFLGAAVPLVPGALFLRKEYLSTQGLFLQPWWLWLLYLVGAWGAYWAFGRKWKKILIKNKKYG
jgi:hypothetical protein